MYVCSDDRLNFFGYSVGDWLAVSSLVLALGGVVSHIFKKVALDPLQASINNLAAQFREDRTSREKKFNDLDTKLKAHDNELASHSERLSKLEK